MNDTDWRTIRAPELRRLFQEHIYGFLPSDHQISFQSDVIGNMTQCLVSCSNRQLNLLVFRPYRKDPAPVFLILNSYGNHTVTTNGAVRISQGWINRNPAGLPPLAKTGPALRGYHAARFPVEDILSRGYAFATLHESDIAPDDPGQSKEVIAQWAWGLKRAVDCLTLLPGIDAKKIAVAGHSRRGKAALLAAAFDERIALCAAHQSGTGGAAPSRKTQGETVRQINDLFPHWFCDTFKNYNDNETVLPVDQHQLLALVAPRPLLLTNAKEDIWADPEGTWQAAQAADAVYKHFGVTGLKERDDLTGKLAWHMRDGGHSIGAEDWDVFMRFADLHLKTKSPA